MSTTTKKSATKTITFTPATAAEELGKTPREIRRLIRSGKLAAELSESGKRWVISRAAIRKYAEAMKQ